MRARRGSARLRIFSAGAGLPSGLVAHLLSDVEGSTRLWQGDESDAAAAIAQHYELLAADEARAGA